MNSKNSVKVPSKQVKIQFFSRNFPVANAFGNSTYVLDFLQYLRQVDFDVEFILLNVLPNGRTPWYIIPSELAKIAKFSVRNHVRIGRLIVSISIFNWVIELVRYIYNQLPVRLKNIYRRSRDEKNITPRYIVPYIPWDIPATPEEIEYINSRIQHNQPDVVITNYAYLSNVLAECNFDKNVLKLILTHDIRHQRASLFKKLKIDAFEEGWSKENEQIALQKADVLLAIQKEEAKILHEMAPKCKVICTPLSATCKSHIISQVPGRCLFVGSHVDHNYYGLQWFLKNVWAKVLQLHPESSLHICGNVNDLIKESFPNVVFLGKVEDIKPEYSAAEVCLIPLLAGSGLKIKLVEAMSYGRACVSTSVGIQGLSDIAGKTVLVTDTADNFASSVVQLLTNTNQRKYMEHEAYKYVKENFSPHSVYQPFIDYIYQHYTIKTALVERASRTASHLTNNRQPSQSHPNLF
ncbi:hypothetical protein NIES2101_07725 [Calothrix sp. HK-06]|nr:hypothetical protein NIES2101_07725 [Calothrix sp. HK-06]